MAPQPDDASFPQKKCEADSFTERLLVFLLSIIPCEIFGLKAGAEAAIVRMMCPEIRKK